MEEEVSTLIKKLAKRKWTGDEEMKSLMEQAHEILSSEPKAEIQHSGSREGLCFLVQARNHLSQEGNEPRAYHSR